MNESVSWSADTLVIPLYLKRQALVEPPVSHPLRAASAERFYSYFHCRVCS